MPIADVVLLALAAVSGLLCQYLHALYEVAALLKGSCQWAQCMTTAALVHFEPCQGGVWRCHLACLPRTRCLPPGRFADCVTARVHVVARYIETMAAMMAKLPCKATSFGSIKRPAPLCNLRVARSRLHRAHGPKRLSQIAVASSVAVQRSQHFDNSRNPLQTLCKNVMVGVAGAALWSVLAAAVTGPSAPFASLTIASTSSGASSKYVCRMRIHADASHTPVTS